ncbi:MAG: DsbA family protein [Chloroflexota bacterium]
MNQYSLGSPNAPVTVVEWADFQCPYCRGFALGAGKQLIQNLVPSGRVRFVWRNFAFLGPESVWAAEAAACAADQGKFWEYHDKLFDEQGGENQGGFSKANLERFASELGLDAAAFDHCLTSDQHQAAVEGERDVGTREGVDATPTIFVNGQKYVGPPTYDRLVAMIDTASAAA